MSEMIKNAWNDYAKIADIPNEPGFDYDLSDVKSAFEAGWKAKETHYKSAIVDVRKAAACTGQ